MKQIVLEMQKNFMCDIASKMLLFLIFIKFMQKEFNRVGIRSFDAVEIARDSQALNAQQRLNLLRKIIRLTSEETAQLFYYLNYIYNTLGSQRAVQDALKDWYLLR